MFRGIRFFLRQGWKYNKRYILWLIFGELLAALVPVVASLMPKYVVDELTGLARPPRLCLYVAVFSGYALLAGALREYFYWDGFTRRCDAGRQFDLAMNRQLLETDYAGVESPRFRDVHDKAQKFLTCDWHGFGYLLDCAVRILGQIITLIGLIVILSTINLWFVCLFAALALMSALIESRAKRRALALSQSVVRDQRGMSYYAKVFDDARFGKEIRLNGVCDWVLARFDAFYRRINQSLKRQNDLFARSGVARSFLTFLQQLAAYAFLICGVLAGGMSVGAFSMCLAAVAAFSEALRRLVESVAELRAYDPYYDDLDRYLHLPKRSDAGGKPIAKQSGHTLTLDKVSFRYPEARDWALRSVSLTLSQGERLALVGENGSGKTTLIKLICGLYAPTEGRILLDGTDIKELAHADYLAQLSAVFQDHQLFEFSIRENITLGKSASDEELLALLTSIGLGALIERLPQGLDTCVGRTLDDKGFLPSGGEAQKLALARALFRGTPVMLLDEPTAALDPRAEYELYRAFDSLTKGKTVVYISHRLSAARFCDRVAVLERGRLKEYGAHDELIRKKGLYAELYAMQAHFYTD